MRKNNIKKDKFAPKNVLLNYRTCKVQVRMGGGVQLVAYASEGAEVIQMMALKARMFWQPLQSSFLLGSESGPVLVKGGSMQCRSSSMHGHLGMSMCDADRLCNRPDAKVVGYGAEFTTEEFVLVDAANRFSDPLAGIDEGSFDILFLSANLAG
eukprot:s22_g44.t1